MNNLQQLYIKTTKWGFKKKENARLSNVTTDARAFSRVALVDLPAEYKFQGLFLPWMRCTALEVSSNGIKLMLPADVKKGAKLKIRLKLPQAKEAVCIKVKVVWSAPSDIAPNFEIGTSFIATPKKDAQDRLTQFIAERLSKSIVWLGAGISVRPVESYDEAISVFHLIYNEYLKRSYCNVNPRELFFCSQSLLPTTEMFIVKKDDNFLGSISLMGDSPAGLPADHLYPEEMSELRRQGRRIAEVGLLALKLDAFPKTFSMGDLKKMRCLFHLFKIMFDYARFTMNVTDLVIHMNPKHRLLYEFLTFESIGPVRYYSNFQNKPAILMRMDVAKTVREQSVPESRCSHFVLHQLPAELLKKRFAWTDEQVRGLVRGNGMWDYLAPAAKEHLISCYPGAA